MLVFCIKRTPWWNKEGTVDNEPTPQYGRAYTVRRRVMYPHPDFRKGLGEYYVLAEFGSDQCWAATAFRRLTPGDGEGIQEESLEPVETEV